MTQTQMMERENGVSPSQRKLGAIEMAMAMLQGFAQGTTQGALVISLTGTMTHRALREAAEWVFRKYALLRCSIETQTDDFYFVEHNNFSRIAVDFTPLSNFDDWDNREVEELHGTLDQSRSLWRLKLFSTPEGAHKIVFVVHHAIVDADGAKLVVRDLLSYSDAFLRGKQAAIDARGLPPSVDDFLPAYSGAAADNTARCDPIPYHVQIPMENRRTRFVRAKLKMLDYSLLENKCKKDHISIDAAYAAALSLAVISSGLTQPPLAIKTAVSLREYVATKRPIMNELGCYIAVADTTLDIKNRDFLSAANEYYKKLLTHTISHSLKKKNISTADVRGSVESTITGRSFNGFAITNVGEMSPPSACERFSIEDIYNLTNRVAGNFAFTLEVSTFRGQPRFNFTYIEHLLRREKLEHVCKEFKRHLTGYYEDNL